MSGNCHISNAFVYIRVSVTVTVALFLDAHALLGTSRERFAPWREMTDQIQWPDARSRQQREGCVSGHGVSHEELPSGSKATGLFAHAQGRWHGPGIPH